MAAQWVGPLPPETFLNAFMQPATPPGEPPAGVQFPSKPKPGRETDMYEPFFDCVRNSKICPNIHFHITAHAKDPNNRYLQRPDGGAVDYPHNILDDTTNTRTRRQTEKGKSYKEQQDSKKPFNWHKHGLMVEFKYGGDPFYDLQEAKDKKTIQKTDDDSSRTLGQLAMYARDSFAHQHRTHLFQLFIFGNEARFIRWDRGGALVSASFDFVEDSKFLVLFFWNYSHLTPVQRGWDMTVSPPMNDERESFSNAITEWIDSHGGTDQVAQQFPGVESTLDPAYPVYKLTVTPQNLGCQQELIIQRPFVMSHDVLGRSTRGYLALSLTENRVVFYKDGWRVDSRDIMSEGSAYRILADCAIENTPTVLCAGDVVVDGVAHKTVSYRWARMVGADWYIVCSILRPLLLHRIVQPVAFPVQSLGNSKRFVRVLRDCLKAMLQAFNAGILHRDISIGNVMALFDDNGKFIKGILNDWDHFGYVDVEKPPRSVRRSGTWAFMSIELLGDPCKHHEIWDDLQSIFWVLLYGSCRFFRTRGSNKIDWAIFTKWAEKTIQGKKTVVGGQGKEGFLALRGYLELEFESVALQRLIRGMGNAWSEYYTLRAVERKQVAEATRTEAALPIDVSADNVVVTDDDSDSDDDGVSDDETEPVSEDTNSSLENTVATSSSQSQVDELSATRLKLKELRAKLSDPQFWIAILRDAIKQSQKELWIQDAVPDQRPQHTVKVASMASRDSHIAAVTKSEMHRESSSSLPPSRPVLGSVPDKTISRFHSLLSSSGNLGHYSDIGDDVGPGMSSTPASSRLEAASMSHSSSFPSSPSQAAEDRPLDHDPSSSVSSATRGISALSLGDDDWVAVEKDRKGEEHTGHIVEDDEQDEEYEVELMIGLE